MAWTDLLRVAYLGGAPFWVDVAETTVGRFTAPHVFPYRDADPAWVEDLGVAPGSVRIVGFLVGDAVIVQQAALMMIMRRGGRTELIHPMLGSMTGVVVGGGGRFLYRRDAGRYVQFTFEFLESAATPFPVLVEQDDGPDGNDDLPDDPDAVHQQREAYFARRQESIRQSIELQRAYRFNATGSTDLPAGTPLPEPTPSYAPEAPSIHEQREAYFAYRLDSIQRSIQVQRAYRASALGYS